jgi:hypothetical protein
MSVDASHPACPRCGYDQSGAVAAWDRVEPACCPLSGLCAECGLEFAWRDLLNPVYSRQLRMFEHARRRKVASFLLTWWKAARPWSFWRWVRMEHEVVPRRLFAMSLLGLGLTHLLLVGISGGVGYLLRTWSATSSGTFSYFWAISAPSALVRAAYPIGVDRSQGEPYDALTMYVTPLELISLETVAIVPFTYVLLRKSLSRARVQRIHLFRIWMCSLIWIPLYIGLAKVVNLGYGFVIISLDAAGMGSTWLHDLYPVAWGGWMTLAFTVSWLVLWWTMAIRDYLRIRHDFWIGTLMTGLAVLIATIVSLVLPGGRWFMFAM